MEIHSAKQNLSIVFFYEFMGTAFLLYSINMAYAYPFGQFGICFTLFAAILIGGPITGAHFNPAVTLGVYISNKHWLDDVNMFLLMIFAQIFGAFFGCLMASLSLYCSDELVPRTNWNV